MYGNEFVLKASHSRKSCAFKNFALNSNNIAFVPKDLNPSNCPQARPIEKFWAICKKAYSKTSITSKIIKQFTRIWIKVSFSVAERSAQTLMAGVRRVLKDIRTNGSYQPIRHKKWFNTILFTCPSNLTQISLFVIIL